MTTPPSDGKYCRVPFDFFELPWYSRLRLEFPDLMERWFFLCRKAQDSRDAGRILILGRSCGAEELARAWDRRPTQEDITQWQAVIDALLADPDAPLTRDDSGCLMLVRPSDWYRPHSKAEGRDYAAEHARRRARAKAREETRADTGRHVQARGDTCRRGETRADTGPKPEPEPEPEPEPPYPALPPHAGSDGQAERGSGGSGGDEVSPVRVLSRTLETALPGILSAQEMQALRRLAEVPGALADKTRALRDASGEVVLETSYPGHAIRWPRRVAIERAIRSLGQARAPDMWANRDEPEYVRLNRERRAAASQTQEAP